MADGFSGSMCVGVSWIMVEMQCDDLFAALCCGGVVRIITFFTIILAVEGIRVIWADVLLHFLIFWVVDRDCGGDGLRAHAVAHDTGVGGGLSGVRYGVGNNGGAEADGGRPRVGEIARATHCGSLQLRGLA